jgi:hypothetical protein
VQPYYNGAPKDVLYVIRVVGVAAYLRLTPTVGYYTHHPSYGYHSRSLKTILSNFNHLALHNLPFKPQKSLWTNPKAFYKNYLGTSKS